MSGSGTAILECNAPAVKGRKSRRGLRLLIFLVVVVVLVAMTEARRVLLGSNFHTVLAGKVYRGAQPSAQDLEEIVPRYHIRTVVNLRGGCDPYGWYLEESRATQSLQVSQEDICFSSGRLPSEPEVRRLVEVLDHADYPLFLHCRRGADRTGLASAIFLLLETETSLAEGRRQLGWRYGHVAVGKTRLLDLFLDLYADWLRRQHREHTRALFRHWLHHEYRSGGNRYQIERFVCTTGQLRTGQPSGFQVRVRNTGDRTWHMRPGPTAGIQLGYILRDHQDQYAASGFWGLFEADVSPGQVVDVMLVVPSLPRAGRYRLVLDLVDPDNGWFFQTGSETFEEELIFCE